MKFSICDLLLVTVIAALTVGWWVWVESEGTSYRSTCSVLTAHCRSSKIFK